MSQQNKPKDVRLPSGGALSWDMTSLTNDQLQYEYDLAFEILNDCYADGKVAIPGMLKEDPDKSKYGRTMFLEALAVWKQRLERATNEIERRYLLS